MRWWKSGRVFLLIAKRLVSHVADKVEAECGKIAMVLMQNKIDLIDKAAISRFVWLSTALETKKAC